MTEIISAKHIVKIEELPDGIIKLFDLQEDDDLATLDLMKIIIQIDDIRYELYHGFPGDNPLGKVNLYLLKGDKVTQPDDISADREFVFDEITSGKHSSGFDAFFDWYNKVTKNWTDYAILTPGC